MYVFVYLPNMLGLLCCVTVRCSAVQCGAVRCSALQCVAVRCSALQCVAMMGLSENTPSLTRCVYLYTYSIDWSVMLCYSVLRCVAVIGLSEYTP